VQAILTILLLLATVSAQNAGTGAVTGHLRDSSGAGIPSVIVRITHIGTSQSRETQTNEDGIYFVGLLQPGRYRLSFSRPGFDTVSLDSVSVSVAEIVGIDQVLKVESLRETVNVTAGADILQTATSAVGRTVGSTQVAELPLVTRNFTQLTALSTGVSSPVADSLALGNGSQNVFTNGTAQLSTTFTIDGVEATNSYSGSAAGDYGTSGVATPSVDAIEEFKVQTALYDAAFGRRAGANINIITKSGTSEFHGDVFEFFRNDALNANSFFFNRVGQHRPVLRQNQFGATVGGPIRRARAYFFSSYEGIRQLNGAGLTSITTLQLPPIPQDRSPASLGAVFGGQTGRSGGLAIAPDGSNINSVALRFLNAKLPNGQFLLPSPQRAGSGVNYGASIPAPYDQDQFQTNADININRRHRLSARYLNSASERKEEFFQSNLPGFTSTIPAGHQNAVLSHAYAMGGEAANEIRAGYVRFTGANSAAAPIKDTDLGIFRATQQDFPGMPQIQVAGAFTIGGPNTETFIVNSAVSLSDTLSLTRQGLGRHDLRVGFEMRKEIYTVRLKAATHRGVMTINSFPDFLLGRAAGPVERGGNGTAFSNIDTVLFGNGLVFRDIVAADEAIFIADDWKIHRKLNLNLGLRYEVLGNLSEKRGVISNFDLRRYSAPPAGGVTSAGLVQPANTAFPLPGIPLVRNTLTDGEDRNNFGPRFGFAYRPSDRRGVLLRGGYGIFYDRLASRPLIQSLGGRSAPWFRQYQLSGAANAGASLQNPFPIPPALSDFPIPFELPDPLSGRPPLNLMFLDPGIRTPYIQQYSLNVQYMLTTDVLLEAGYAGSKGTRLETLRGFNQSLLASPSHPVRGITTNSAANAPARVPYVGFSSIGLTGTTTEGTSNYNSLQVSLTKRFSHGIQFLGSYTYGKSLTTVNTNSGLGDNLDVFTSGAQDNYNIRGDGYGPANFDRTHRVVISYVYDVPAVMGSGILAKIFSGWRTSGVIIAQSGLPFSITDSLGGTIYGINGSRASFAPDATIETALLSGDVESRLSRYFNTAAFARAPVISDGEQINGKFPVADSGTLFGNTGRNILRGPGQRNFDAALARKAKLREASYLEFRAEFFNAFNNVNFALPHSNIASTDFGVIDRTSSSPRVIQLALKLHF